MYIARLQDFPSLGASNLSAEVFNMTLQTIAECWKRFVLPTETFPWSLFKLLDCVTIDEFLVLLTDLQAKQAASPCCVDVEFSTPLLKFVTAADTGILGHWEGCRAQEPIGRSRSACTIVFRSCGVPPRTLPTYRPSLERCETYR